jgi:dTDP-4-dehydrorhamnose 3,5-epimerase
VKTSHFDIIDLPLEGLKIIARKPMADDRGHFERLFCRKELETSIGIGAKEIQQINQSLTIKRGSLRGLHFQYPPHGETKLVTCLKGKVFDVAVDIRCNSSTYLHWHAELLSGDNHRSMLIPEGFAHGFQTLSPDCTVLYFHTAAYHKDSEGGLNALDPTINIAWPLPISERSNRDCNLPLWNEDFKGAPQ